MEFSTCLAVRVRRYYTTFSIGLRQSTLSQMISLVVTLAHSSIREDGLAAISFKGAVAKLRSYSNQLEMAQPGQPRQASRLPTGKA